MRPLNLYVPGGRFADIYYSADNVSSIHTKSPERIKIQLVMSVTPRDNTTLELTVLDDPSSFSLFLFVGHKFMINVLPFKLLTMLTLGQYNYLSPPPLSQAA